MYIIVTLIVIFAVILIYRYFTVGAPFFTYLRVTQSLLLKQNFPTLSDIDCNDILNTVVLDSIRHSTYKSHYKFYLGKQWGELEKAIDLSMTRAMVYIIIEAYQNGIQSKQETISFLNQQSKVS